MGNLSWGHLPISSRVFSWISGGPGVTRTLDLRFRKPLLYPSELQGHLGRNSRPFYFTCCNRNKVFTFHQGLFFILPQSSAHSPDIQTASIFLLLFPRKCLQETSYS